MIIEKIGTGNSIAEAYENAKLLLAAPDEAELHQEIIQDVKKKLFGLKTEPAKVKVWYEIADKPVKEAPVKPAAQPKPQPTAKAKSENTAPKAAPKAQKPAQEKKAHTDTKPAAAAKPASETPAVVNTAVETKSDITALEIKENDGAANYIKMIIEGMGIKDYTLSLTKSESTNEYTYTINCDEDGTLIGKRGDTLDAIQYLLRLSINKGLDDDKHRKVSVNIGNYREKRNDNLRALAHKSAKQVLKYGRNVVLDPMNPYERRIVHTAIQEIEGVTSHSIGVDSGRKVIISLEEGVQPTHPSKGGYHKGSRPDRRRGGSKGGYQKKEAYQPSQTRAPRKDSAGSLYGKIEIPTKTTEE